MTEIVTKDQAGRWRPSQLSTEPLASTERVVAHVDMNAFFASCEQQAHPHLRGRPVAVCGNPSSRTVVAAASYEAKACGIENGMSVPKARQLCPELIVVGGNPHLYVDVSRHVMELFHEYTSDVEVFSVDEAFMEWTPVLDRWEVPEALARDIKARIHARYGLTCSVGIGPNKLVAKLASGLQKPDGLVRVRAAEVPTLFDTLPVEALCGIGPRLKVHLESMGVTTCGQLGRLPQDTLMKRFGIVGWFLGRMGRGEDHAPVQPYRSAAVVKSMGHSYTLDQDAWDLSTVLGVLLRLCEQVGRRLRRDGYRGRTVSATVRFRDFNTVTKRMTVHRFLDDGYAIYQVARRMVIRLMSRQQAVRLVGVGVSQLHQEGHQLSCLEEDRRAGRMVRAMDHINDRFGEHTVGRAAAHRRLTPKTHGFLHPKRPSQGTWGAKIIR